jgi:uncharacterized protein YfiM (DUF2279 family)
MAAIGEHVRELRAQRRATVRALSVLDDARLTERVPGIGRSSDVRATLLALAEDDDRNCAALVALLEAAPAASGAGQRISAALGRTRGYLRAVLVGVSDDRLDEQPAADEWSVRQALQHVRNNESRFVVDARYAVERLGSAQPPPLERADPDRGPGTLGPPLPGGIDDVLAVLEETRDQITGLAATLSADELSAATTWAGQTVDLRFMLQRRATHERQHTVQVEKTLRAIGVHQNETQMLLAQAEIARGALEGALLGAPDGASGSARAALEQILVQARTQEQERVAAILQAV